MPKVISIVSYQFLPAKFGGQKAIAIFNKYFSRFVELNCITTQNNDPNVAEGYQVMPILSTSPLRYINPLNFYTIRKQVREKQATHLMLEHPYLGWLGLFIKHFCGVKLIIRSHNIEGKRWKDLGKWWWKILLWYEQLTHRRADYNFFIQQEDMEYAILNFKLDSTKCILVTYGVEISQSPSVEKRKLSRDKICNRHSIDPNDYILLFNGAFEYIPNRNALDYLLNQINPILLDNDSFKYKLLICGRNIPAHIASKSFPNVIIAGFVENIDEYFDATDVFVNPTKTGGGIKTKLVEAIAHNCNAVSTRNGAIGVDPAICNGKLLVVADNDQKLFAEGIFQVSRIQADTGAEFFQHFFEENIARRAAQFIDNS